MNAQQYIKKRLSPFKTNRNAVPGFMKKEKENLIKLTLPKKKFQFLLINIPCIVFQQFTTFRLFFHLVTNGECI